MRAHNYLAVSSSIKTDYIEGKPNYLLRSFLNSISILFSDVYIDLPCIIYSVY